LRFGSKHLRTTRHKAPGEIFRGFLICDCFDPGGNRHAIFCACGKTVFRREFRGGRRKPFPCSFQSRRHRYGPLRKLAAALRNGGERYDRSVKDDRDRLVWRDHIRRRWRDLLCDFRRSRDKIFYNNGCPEYCPIAALRLRTHRQRVRAAQAQRRGGVKGKCLLVLPFHYPLHGWINREICCNTLFVHWCGEAHHERTSCINALMPVALGARGRCSPGGGLCALPREGPRDQDRSEGKTGSEEFSESESRHRGTLFHNHPVYAPLSAACKHQRERRSED